MLHEAGEERQPIVVVDGFFADPEALIARAEADARAGAFVAEPGNFYPGLRCALPRDCAGDISNFIDRHLTEIFAISPGRRITTEQLCFSLATTRPSDLLPIQAIPHFDTSEPDQIAMVVYLCDPRHGGTSFYRHRATGYESIGPERAQHYRRSLEREATRVGLPPRDYIRGDSRLFLRTLAVEARFNRAVFYHSNLLHAGTIDPASGLSPVPRHGRLTVTALNRFADVTE